MTSIPSLTHIEGVTGASYYFKPTIAVLGTKPVSCNGLYIMGTTREAIDKIYALLVLKQSHFAAEAAPPLLVAGGTTIMLLPRKAETGVGFSDEFISKIQRISGLT